MNPADAKKLTKLFSREQMRTSGAAGVLTRNTILLPQYFEEQTLELCNGSNEKAGWLICRKYFSGDYILYVVEYIYVTDEGGSGHVYPTKKINTTNEHSALEFHIHPRGLGNLWFDKFSNGDYETLVKRIAIEPFYKHVLFTPTYILTFAKEKPDFRIAKTSDEALVEIQEREQYWADKFPNSH